MLDAAIIGAPGYAGVELTRLILGHPELRLTRVTSSAEAGRRVDDVYPVLTGLTDLEYVEPDAGEITDAADIAFLAVPHTAALGIAPQLIDGGLVVIDASADFRFTDPGVYEEWYGVEHTSPDLLETAVYGLPELTRDEIPGANLIACAGCYPTASILAALPALEAGLASTDLVVVDAKSGVSGAGKAPSAGTHFPTVNEAVSAYKVTTHRHTPEIEQGMGRVAGRHIRTVFTPHLVPMNRGLLSTVYLEAVPGLTTDKIVHVYQGRYADEPFITVHPAGRMPSTAEVRGTNRAHIGVAVDDRTDMIIAVCAIDNLVKGTSGQAIQCANIRFGMPETTGLDVPVPVV